MNHTPHNPPRWASWLLNRLLPDGDSQTPVGDFEEYYNDLSNRRGRLQASIWYLLQVLGLIPRRISNAAYWHTIMFKNYLKTSYRNLLRYKTYSAINLLGLTLGTACFLLIFVYVQEERGFDSFHQDADRMYRLNVDFINPSSVFSNALSSAPIGPSLQAVAPGIEAMTRISGMRDKILLQYGDRHFFEKDGFYADSTFFDVFLFPLIQGESSSVLTAPRSVVLTQSMARKYFGLDDPVGETLRFNNAADFIITGVMSDIPTNSHLEFDFLISFSTLTGSMNSWFSNPYFTYFKLGESVSPADVEAQAVPLVEANMAEAAARAGSGVRLWLQPVLDIRLNPQANDVSTGRGSRHLMILSGIAIFILLLACINFVNLATARSATRAKEVGMRKVIGAGRGQLIAQFLGESALLAFLACGLGVLAAEYSLSLFGQLVGREVAMSYDISLLGSVFLIGFIVTLISGIYPALYLSRMQPAKVLKGVLGAATSGKSYFRNSLVVLQFAVSVTLIIATITVYKQVQFMKTYELGLDAEQVTAIPINRSLADQSVTLKQQFQLVTGVESVTYASRAPGTGAYGNVSSRPNTDDDRLLPMKYLLVDHDYADVLEISMAAGRFYSADRPADGERGFVVNEQAVRDFGWSSPAEAVGETINWSGDRDGVIIGVIEDFHFQSMTVHMQPLVLIYSTGGQGYLMARTSTNELSSVMTSLETTWSQVAPEWPFVFSFLDADFDALYQSEEQFGRIFSTFTFLALIIACLGLFGLATFAVQQRTREMGIRKAMGATGGGIVVLLSKNFAWLVITANVIAWPLSYFALQRWLDGFAFRTSLSWWVFLAAGIAALLIAVLTVSVQALKASRANPVEALRFQ